MLRDAVHRRPPGGRTHFETWRVRREVEAKAPLQFAHEVTDLARNKRMRIAVWRGNKAGGEGKNIKHITGQTEVRIENGNVVDCDSIQLIYS